jgi:hypothetical protein
VGKKIDGPSGDEPLRRIRRLAEGRRFDTSNQPQPQGSTRGKNPQGPTTSQAKIQYISEARFRRAVDRLVALGPRAVAEFIAELGARFFIRTAIDLRLAEYAARLSPELLAAASGDRFPDALHNVVAEQVPWVPCYVVVTEKVIRAGSSA